MWAGRCGGGVSWGAEAWGLATDDGEVSSGPCLRYEICMRPRREGIHSLWILLNGEHVLGSPCAVSVIASTPSARRCNLRGISTEVTAGGEAELAVALLDEYGNELVHAPTLLPLQLLAERVVDPLALSVSTIEHSMDVLDG